MRKRDARRLVCRTIAALLDAEVANGSYWLTQGGDGADLSPADRARVRAAVADLRAEMLRRSGETT